MKGNHSLNKKFILFSLLLISSLLVAACGGTAAVELDAETVAQSELSQPEQENAIEAEAQADTAAEAEGNAETETADDADVSAEVEDEASVPVIVPGSPEFHATEPSTVTLASGQVQFVEFFAYWCSVCKAMAPSVHGLEAAYSDRVNFVYLDRDNPATESLRNQLGYFYQPHIFILDSEGNILYNRSGYVEVAELQAAIEAALQ